MNATENREDQETPRVIISPKVDALVEAGIAAWGGYNVSQGGKDLVYGLFLLTYVVINVSSPPRLRGRFLVAGLAAFLTIIAVDLIWHPWSW